MKRVKKRTELLARETELMGLLREFNKRHSVVDERGVRSIPRYVQIFASKEHYEIQSAIEKVRRELGRSPSIWSFPREDIFDGWPLGSKPYLPRIIRDGLVVFDEKKRGYRLTEKGLKAVTNPS